MGMSTGGGGDFGMKTGSGGDFGMKAGGGGNFGMSARGDGDFGMNLDEIASSMNIEAQESSPADMPIPDIEGTFFSSL